MAAEAEAFALAAVNQSPESFRRLLETVFGYRPGIAAAGDWAVSQNGTPNMSVNVAAGRGFVDGTESANQGGYFGQSTTVTNLAISASNPTNPRRDLVIARVRDNEYATGPTSAFSLEVVTGTPAASPSDPSVPANSLVIARVAVAANATTILTANITDLRTSSTGQQRLTALGGTAPVTSSSKPTVGLYEGSKIYVTDIDSAQVYNGSAWIGLAAASSPQPQFFTGTVSNGTATTQTAFVTQNSILTAPFPLTMVVMAQGDLGANGALNTVSLSVRDEAGNNISTSPGAIAAGVTQFRNYNTVDGKGYSLIGHKVYAAGATCGFRLYYNVDTSNIYIAAGVVVMFIPRLT